MLRRTLGATALRDCLESLQAKNVTLQTSSPPTKETEMEAERPQLPPFTAESAAQKVRLAEDARNMRGPGRVALAY